MLIVLAKQVQEQFKEMQLDINELINVGWFSQARYMKSVKGKSTYIKRMMFNWVLRERKMRLTRFDGDYTGVYKVF